MKKIIIIGSSIVVLFAALIFVTSYQDRQQAEGNPFGLESLHAETVDQLDDPNYQNIILPEELDERLENDGDATIYFYSGQCEICNRTSPVIVPMADDMDVELELYNVLEFDQGWEDYQIEGTPTVIHFEDGEEVGRLTGGQEVGTYEQFFEQISER